MMSREEIPTDIIDQVAQTGDPIDAFNFRAIPELYKPILLTGGAWTSGIVLNTASEGIATPLSSALVAGSVVLGSLIAGAALPNVPYRGRKTAADREKAQCEFEADMEEPVELFHYGNKNDGKTAFYWRAVTEDRQQASLRLGQLMDRFAATGCAMPATFMLPLETHRAIWPDSQIEPVSMNAFMKELKRTTFRVGADSMHVLIPFADALAVREMPIENTSGLDYLLDTYGKLSINGATKELIANYQSDPDTYRQRMRTAIAQVTYEGLKDTGYSRTSQQRTRMTGQLNGATIMWSDNRGHFSGFQKLSERAGITTPLSREEITKLTTDDPDRAKEVIEAYLYLGLRDQTAVSHLSGQVIEKEAHEYGSVHADAVLMFADGITPTSGHKPQNEFNRRRNSRFMAAMLAIGVITATNTIGYAIANDTLNREGLTEISRDDASVDAPDSIAGLKYLAEQGDAAAEIIYGIRNVGVTTHTIINETLGLSDSGDKIDSPFSDLLSTFGLGRNNAIGNVDTGGRNLVFWDVTATGQAAAEGYWIDSVNNTFGNMHDGWYGTYLSEDQTSLPLLSPDELAAVPDKLQVSRTTSVFVYDGITIPVRSGMTLAGLEITNAQTGEAVPASAYLDLNGITRLAIDTPSSQEVDITYWLTPSNEEQTHAAANLSFVGISPSEMSSLLPAELQDMTDPIELASYIRTHYTYSTSPLDIAMSPNTTIQDFLTAISDSGKLNCNTAATLFAMAAYASGMENVSYATGYLNGQGDDDTTISSREGHAFIINEQGNIIDPTPAGPLTEEDQAFFNESAVNPDEPSTIDMAMAKHVSLGGLALGGLLGMAWFARRQLRIPASQRQLKRLKKANPATLGMARNALAHEFYDEAETDIADRYQLVTLKDLAMKSGPRDFTRADFKKVRLDGRRLPRAVIRAALDIAAAPWTTIPHEQRKHL